jgi:hypothetical protein
MLTKSKQRQLLASLKGYYRQYLKNLNPELDESGTRLMINSFLTEVLCFAPIEEVKTEYMIRGTYADYVVQLQGVRYFLVEVKALGIELSEKHLRQAVNYGANEGIEWAVLSNGKQFDFYKILFNKPIEERKIFSIDLSDISKFKYNAGLLQYLHKLSITNKGLDTLWNKCVALDPITVAGLLQNKPVVNFIKRALKRRYKNKFSDEEVIASLNRVIYEPIRLEDVKQRTVRSKKRNDTKNKETPKAKMNTQTKQVSESVNSLNNITTD